MQKQFRHLVARAMRAGRAFSSVRGFATLAERVGPIDSAFVVKNRGEVFAGNLNSAVDRKVFLYGGYERWEIDAFLALVPRKRVALDVGANAGTHTVAFGRAFDKVHSFEPNPLMWAQLERNVALNAIDATVHRFGLSDRDGELPFFDIDNDNAGLGTFSTDEQYDRPLQQIAVASVRTFDDLPIEGPIDAVKIDVQGLEQDVLRGMQAMLRRERPALWVEIGGATGLASSAALRDLIPYPVKLLQVEAKSGIVHRHWLAEPGERPAIGNVFALPA